jgi:hypothetical protein
MENGQQSAFACVSENYLQHGLTKREYFTGLAMQGWIACQHEGFTGEPDTIAERSVKCADAVLAELEKTEKGEG